MDPLDPLARDLLADPRDAHHGHIVKAAALDGAAPLHQPFDQHPEPLE